MTRHLRSMRSALAAGAVLLSAGAAHAQLVINEIDYDQAEVGDSTDRAEFIEIYNDGSASVDLASYSLVLFNGANGTSYATIPLSGTLAAGDFYVVCGDPSNVVNCDLDGGADTNLIQNGAPDGVQLLESGLVVDSLSYEGDMAGVTEGSSAPTDNAGSTSAPIFAGLSRCPNGNDTDDNSVDFVVADPTPGAGNACDDGPECASDDDCDAGQVCTGGSCEDSADDFGACGDLATPIHGVQGNGDTSPLAGQTVVIEGVVVGDFQDEQINGLFIQEEDGDADGDATTSEGVFVYNVATPVNAGDVVRIQGQVAEFSDLTELTNVSNVAVCPQSGSVTPTVVTLPVPSVGDFEALEGMLVNFSQALTVTEVYNLGRYGSISLSAPGRLYQPTQLAEPGAAAAAVRDLNDRSRIELDDLSTSQNPNPIPYKNGANTRRAGATVSGLEGILSGRFGTYRVQPTGLVSFVDAPRPASPPAVGGDLKVVSFNVLNFFTTLDEGGAVCGPSNLGCRGADSALEYDRQLTKLLNALELLNADVYGLNELENNDSASLSALVDGLNGRLGANTYGYVDTGTLGTDAIKVGFIYKIAAVQAVGGFAVLDSTVDPRFIDTKNRPVLAQTFESTANGARFTAAVVHLKSKGSSCDDVGDPDAGDLSGNCNGTRTQAAEALTDWLATDPTGSADSDFLVMGDFNAYAKEDPIDAMKAAGYEELVNSFIGTHASSYIFFGESGYLDYAFASASLASQVTDTAEWGHNGDEPSVLDYNVEFKTDDPFNANDPFRASDHDSLVVGLSLSGADPNAPLCNGRPATVYVRGGVIVGGPLDGQVYAGSLRGTSDADVISGTSNDDTILAGAGDDEVCAGNGNDDVRGGPGADRIDGGGGDDDLRGQAGDDTIDGGAGQDLILGGAGNDTLFGSAGDDDLRGQEGDDTIDGGLNQDLVLGGAGNDTLNGGAGDDDVRGQDGDDTVSGGPGNDRLQGGAGNDSLSGDGGDDDLRGQDGDDILNGGVGHDQLRGGSDNDTLIGDNGNDTLMGGAGDDSLSGGRNQDACAGQGGTDTTDGTCENVSSIP